MSLMKKMSDTGFGQCLAFSESEDILKESEGGDYERNTGDSRGYRPV